MPGLQRAFMSFKALSTVAKHNFSHCDHMILIWLLGNLFTLTANSKLPCNHVITILQSSLPVSPESQWGTYQLLCSMTKISVSIVVKQGLCVPSYLGLEDLQSILIEFPIILPKSN